MYRDAATIRDTLVSILVVYVVIGLIFSPLQKLKENELQIIINEYPENYIKTLK